MSMSKRNKDILIRVENNFPNVSTLKQYVVITENIHNSKELFVYYHKDGEIRIKLHGDKGVRWAQ